MVVEQFLAWIDNAPVQRRVEAADALVRAFLYSPVSEDERLRLEAGMTVLLEDSSPKVRNTVAAALGNHPDAPRHVVLSLAHDQADIARPVLAYSPVLLDADLVDIVGSGNVAKQTVIAERLLVSVVLAAAIAEVAEPPALIALVGNMTATIARFSLMRIAERHGSDPNVRDALLNRPGLPADVHQVLVDRVGEALRELVTLKAWLNPERATTVIREAREKATLGMCDDMSAEDMSALIEHLRVSGQLTAALLMRSLCAGNMAFFEAVLCHLSGQPARRVCAILSEKREPAVRALCLKAGLPERTVPAVMAALDTHHEMIGGVGPHDGYRFSRRMVDRVMSRFEEFGEDDATDLLAMLRRFSADAARDAARTYVNMERAAA